MDEQIDTLKTWLGTGSVDLFGRPFSGKDTQGDLLAEVLSAPLISGGEILRNHDDPKKIEEIMASGGLIPSDYFFGMVLPYLSKPEFKGKPLVLDALGRSAGEEETILRATERSGHPLKAVVLLQVSEEEIWRRFEHSQQEQDRGGRRDDSRGVLKNRLLKFQEKTMPVIEFYRSKGLLVEVDGQKSPDEVAAGVLAALTGRIRS